MTLGSLTTLAGADVPPGTTTSSCTTSPTVPRTAAAPAPSAATSSTWWNSVNQSVFTTYPLIVFRYIDNR